MVSYMNIKRIELYPVVLRYREPFRIALGTSVESQNVVVKIHVDSGVVGVGEASPSEMVTRETPQTVIEAIDRIAPRLIGTCPLRIERIAAMMDQEVTGDPSAKAAIDVALHDILGKAVRKPLFRLMGGFREEVLTDITLGMKEPGEVARDAVRAVRRGFRALKVKVGVNPGEDFERVRRVREAVGPEISIRIDANQGWTVDEAVDVLSKLERFNIKLVEQPVKAEDIRGLAEVREKSPIPVMADESVHASDDAIRVIKEGAADLINIKLMKSGGILKARKIAAMAEAANVPCMIGCMGESTIGITGRSAPGRSP